MIGKSTLGDLDRKKRMNVFSFTKKILFGETGIGVAVSGKIYFPRFAWLPELCQDTTSQFAGTVSNKWVWLQKYWKSESNGNLMTPHLVTNQQMRKMREFEAHQIQRNVQAQASHIAQQPLPPSLNGGSTAYVSSIGMAVQQEDDPMKRLEEEINRMVDERMKKFMDEFFSCMPASIIPAEQIERLYQQMGYEE